MADWTFRVRDLGQAVAPGRPSDTAVAAMAMLGSRRFLTLTARERARQVHHGACCRPTCGLCEDIALRHAVWAANKLHKHLAAGPPTTGGEPVRDWVLLLDWVTGPQTGEVALAAVRAAQHRRLDPQDPLLPFVLAFGTQLLPTPGDARGPRRMRDVVGDPRRSILAQRHGWAVKPDRDLLTLKRFATVRAEHPVGVGLLVLVLKQLEFGDGEPYRSVLDRPEAAPGDTAALRAVVAALLADPQGHDWFMTNVDARQTFNQDLARRRFRFAVAPDASAS